MKVNTDGVLLGSWVETGSCTNILEVGCGSGFISLMLAQRCSGKILAIDIHDGSIADAGFNFNRSPWAPRLEARKMSLQDLGKEPGLTFDLIVSNPPFFSHSLLSGNEIKDRARHQTSLTYEALAEYSSRLLKYSGVLAVIVPADNFNTLDRLAQTNGLYLNRRAMVSSFPVSGTIRIMAEWIKGKTSQPVEDQSFSIYSAPQQRSNEYSELVAPYLL
ncbi:MAG: methyltransferase [Bacteroidales bacterium]